MNSLVYYLITIFCAFSLAVQHDKEDSIVYTKSSLSSHVGMKKEAEKEGFDGCTSQSERDGQYEEIGIPDLGEKTQLILTKDSRMALTTNQMGVSLAILCGVPIVMGFVTAPKSNIKKLENVAIQTDENMHSNFVDEVQTKEKCIETADKGDISMPAQEEFGIYSWIQPTGYIPEAMSQKLDALVIKLKEKTMKSANICQSVVLIQDEIKNKVIECRQADLNSAMAALDRDIPMMTRQYMESKQKDDPVSIEYNVLVCALKQKLRMAVESETLDIPKRIASYKILPEKEIISAINDIHGGMVNVWNVHRSLHNLFFNLLKTHVFKEIKTPEDPSWATKREALVTAIKDCAAQEQAIVDSMAIKSDSYLAWDWSWLPDALKNWHEHFADGTIQELNKNFDELEILKSQRDKFIETHGVLGLLWGRFQRWYYKTSVVTEEMDKLNKNIDDFSSNFRAIFEAQKPPYLQNLTFEQLCKLIKMSRHFAALRKNREIILTIETEWWHSYYPDSSDHEISDTLMSWYSTEGKHSSNIFALIPWSNRYIEFLERTQCQLDAMKNDKNGILQRMAEENPNFKEPDYAETLKKQLEETLHGSPENLTDLYKNFVPT